MKDAILVLGGAFNPVHTQHIDLLCSAKNQLEKTGEWNILGGYLAVATDGYVRNKLKSRNERTIKLEHRLALVREAMKDQSWLSNSPFQNEMLQRHDGSALALSERVKKLLKNSNIQTLILIGGDRMMKKGIPIWRQSSNTHSVIRVGIGRLDEQNVNLFDLWKHDIENNLIHNPKEFILLDLPLRSVSSSLIRSYLAQWSNSPEKQLDIEHELTEIQSYLHSNVMNYIKQHQHDLYINE